MRKQYQRDGDIHIFGLTTDEEDRIDRFEDENPNLDLEWILQDNDITKNDCYRIINEAGIELPVMYQLGYSNNNCVGCVKVSSAGYWNKIRADFKCAFDRMARQERKMNVAINKSYAQRIELADGSVIANQNRKRVRIFLDELHSLSGRDVPMPDIECGVLCINDKSNRAEAESHLESKLNSAMGRDHER